MNEPFFRTMTGQKVPTITTGQMREVDRIAVEEFGLGVLQMMENAGRVLSLALPKTGLRGLPGEWYLADIGIPPVVYDSIGVPYRAPCDRDYIVPSMEA